MMPQKRRKPESNTNVVHKGRKREAGADIEHLVGEMGSDKTFLGFNDIPPWIYARVGFMCFQAARKPGLWLNGEYPHAGGVVVHIVPP
jgi:hypothetical protein